MEISSTNTHLNVAAYDVESPESLLIELPEKRAQEILREFQNDYERMACSLQVMNKRLVLLNPVSFSGLNTFRNSFSRKNWPPRTKTEIKMKTTKKNPRNLLQECKKLTATTFKTLRLAPVSNDEQLTFLVLK